MSDTPPEYEVANIWKDHSALLTTRHEAEKCVVGALAMYVGGGVPMWAMTLRPTDFSCELCGDLWHWVVTGRQEGRIGGLNSALQHVYEKSGARVARLLLRQCADGVSDSSVGPGYMDVLKRRMQEEKELEASW